MKKKLLSMILACTMVVGMLSGCGSKEEAADAPEATEEVVEETAESEEPVVENVTISVGQWPDPDASPEQYERMETSRKDFMDKYPHIEVIGDPWTYDVQSFAAKAEAGTLPTVYRTYFTEADMIMESEYAADITEGLKNLELYDKLNEDLFQTISKNDKVYLVPNSMYTMGLVINMNLFREAGLVDENDAPIVPDTFEELKETAKIIKEKTGKAGFVVPTTGNTGGWLFMNMAWGYGTEFMTQQDGNWVATFNSEECTEALQLLQDMMWEDGSLPANSLMDLNAVSQMVGTDQAAMTFAHPGMLIGYIQSYGLDINSLAFAKMPAGPERRATLIGGDVYAVAPNASQAEIDAALTWIKWVGVNPDYTEEQQEKYRTTVESKSANLEAIYGVSDLSIWNETATVKSFKDAVNEEYRNIPEKNVASYNDKSELELQAEAPVCAQDLYSTLDTCIQEVLTNENADCAEVLSNAAADFQSNYLDYENNK